MDFVLLLIFLHNNPDQETQEMTSQQIEFRTRAACEMARVEIRKENKPNDVASWSWCFARDEKFEPPKQ